MAQFYAQVQGNRGIASRIGTKNSGMWAHIRGWNIGIRIEIVHINGKDMIHLYRTNGSNDPTITEIGTLQASCDHLLEA